MAGNVSCNDLTMRCCENGQRRTTKAAKAENVSSSAARIIHFFWLIQSLIRGPAAAKLLCTYKAPLRFALSRHTRWFRENTPDLRKCLTLCLVPEIRCLVDRATAAMRAAHRLSFLRQSGLDRKKIILESVFDRRMRKNGTATHASDYPTCHSTNPLGPLAT